MKLIDNVNNSLKEDLKSEIKRGDRLAIVAASFSIYAYKELKKELSNVKELDFIFNNELFLGRDEELMGLLK
ncbi:hypothetical protein [Pseudobutyrivibrio sp.]|uniref:hypothetical protein n=1 Tax=Pseudobutyrivibrio sp. TaxID=2014367 RepID=UPI0025E935DF|nr:hypothetical protein [Pseudobutyrivibrio sp.]